MNIAKSGDWAAIRRRMATTGEALNFGSAPSPEEDRQILKERAEAMGVQSDALAEPVIQLKVVEFDLANERYAFPLDQVREVCALRELTPVPCTPAFILGIINLRGEILTVLNLKTFFDLPAGEITPLNKILILHSKNISLGVLADSIRSVRMLHADELQASLPTLTGSRADYLHGITCDRTVVLDVTKLLSDKRLLVDD